MQRFELNEGVKLDPDKMGGMTDETPENIQIIKFYSRETKLYYFSGSNTIIRQSIIDYDLTKFKGITLRRAVEGRIDCEKFRALVKQEAQELRSPVASIRRSICTGRLRNQFCEKVTIVTSKKRVFCLELGRSIPLGYCSHKFFQLTVLCTKKS